MVPFYFAVFLMLSSISSSFLNVRSKIPQRLNPANKVITIEKRGAPRFASAFSAVQPQRKAATGQFMKMRTQQPTTRAGITVPDVQVILDVIINGCNKIDQGIADIVNHSINSIAGTVTATAEKEHAIIEPAIVDGNAAIKSGLTSIFLNASTDMDKIVEEVTQNELLASSDVLKVKDTELTKRINDLIIAVNTSINELMQQHGIAEESMIKSLIDTANQDLYKQIENILNDPKNNDPIIPQLKFPDAGTIANSIVPGKGALYTEIETLLNKLIADIKLAVAEVQDYETKGVTGVMSEGTQELISKLENATKNVLVLVQLLLDDVSKAEIEKITSGLTPLNEKMKTDIMNEVLTISTKSEALISEVTLNELSEMSTVISKYNQDIAQNMLNNLKA